MMAVMDRDYRLTGKFRGQTDKAEAPLGYEGSWRLYWSQKHILLTYYSEQRMEGLPTPISTHVDP